MSTAIVSKPSDAPYTVRPVQHRPPAGHKSTPQEAPGAVHPYQLLLIRAVSLDEQHFPGMDGSPFAVGLQGVQPGMAQPRVSPVQIRWLGHRSRFGRTSAVMIWCNV